MNYFEQLTSIHESLNYFKEFFLNEDCFILLIWQYALSLCYIDLF